MPKRAVLTYAADIRAATLKGLWPAALPFIERLVRARKAAPLPKRHGHCPSDRAPIDYRIKISRKRRLLGSDLNGVLLAADVHCARYERAASPNPRRRRRCDSEEARARTDVVELGGRYACAHGIGYATCRCRRPLRTVCL